MKKLKATEIRKIWLDFFASKGHRVEQSSSLVPHEDPTLLWINAGVAPLKKYFDGSVKPLNPRIVNAQKCIRTNDIENVGLTARHHTFFEMLGNFSIGDYFKDVAIEYAYELLTKYFEFPLDKLYFTVYPKDIDTYQKWLSLGIKQDHIIKLENNFWEIGEGPCGPDTEIFFDRGSKYDKRGKELIESDIENDRFIEIWNIVFSQYNAKEGLKRSEYPELPSRNIDTGMGLERMACVLQEVDTNYETDLFIDYIHEIEKISQVKYHNQMAFKVIADHIRTLTFAISDGAILSNEGRGYVLRRILRRAAKHARSIGINHPFMYTLVDLVVEKMHDYYPSLDSKKEIVKNIVKLEEEKFLETLSVGEKRIEEIIAKTKNISGKDAFILYDTYGFPIELTLEYANDANILIDLDAFNEEMEKQKNQSRNARNDVSSMKMQNEEFLAFNLDSRFIGYEKLECQSKVIGVFNEGIVLDKTPIYATSGGQLADQGFINDFPILDCIKMPNGQFLHIIKDHHFKVGDQVKVLVNKTYRDQIRRNHSSAHLLHKALKEVLGSHVHQQGSQISYEEMRFDFNHYHALKNEEILEIEKLVKEQIQNKIKVTTKVMSLEDAKKSGAEALFDEKYADNVRVVDMGYSKELCGGTHVSNTNDIIEFAITRVETIGSGMFRITAVTGSDALDKVFLSLINFDNEFKGLIEKGNRIVKDALNDKIKLSFNPKKLSFTNPSYMIYLTYLNELNNLKEEIKNLEINYAREKAKKALSNLSLYDQDIDGMILVKKVIGMNMDTLKQLSDALLNKMQKGIILLASVIDNKIIYVSKNNLNLDSGLYIRKIANLTGGNGGGKKDMATGGGNNLAQLDQALDIVKKEIKCAI